MSVLEQFGKKSRPRLDPMLPQPAVPRDAMAMVPPPSEEDAARSLLWINGMSTEIKRLTADLEHARNTIELQQARVVDLESQLKQARFELEGNRRYGCTVQAHLQTAMDALARAHNAGIDAIGKPDATAAEQIIADTADLLAEEIGKKFGADAKPEA